MLGIRVVELMKDCIPLKLFESWKWNLKVKQVISSCESIVQCKMYVVSRSKRALTILILCLESFVFSTSIDRSLTSTEIWALNLGTLVKVIMGYCVLNLWTLNLKLPCDIFLFFNWTLWFSFLPPFYWNGIEFRNYSVLCEARYCLERTQSKWN